MISKNNAEGGRGWVAEGWLEQQIPPLGLKSSVGMTAERSERQKAKSGKRKAKSEPWLTADN
jgi:hypothetical protein